MPAQCAYIGCIQYTLRKIPPNLDRALREKAERERKSLNEAAVEALARGVGLDGEDLRQRDLSDIAGTWVADPDLDRALEEQRTVDPDLWR